MTRNPLFGACAALGAIAATAAFAEDRTPLLAQMAALLPPPTQVAAMSRSAPEIVAARRAPRPSPTLAPVAPASGTGLRVSAPAADFGIADAVPEGGIFAPPKRQRPRIEADEGLAGRGGFELGGRLSLDLDSGLNYAFSDRLTGTLGYGDVDTGDDGDEGGLDLGLDSPSVGLTFRF